MHELILDAAGEGIYGLDCEGRTTFGNAAIKEILGWHPRDVIGQKAHDLHHHSHPDGSPYPRTECPIYAALKDGEVHRVDDEVFWHSNGSAVPVEYTSTPIRQDGQLQGAVVVFWDVSERRGMERQREAAYKEIKRLRALQEREFERVGDDRTITVDVRVVAATNRDLEAEIQAGRFREDLFYRLIVFPIVVPPLRERPEDIASLAQHFLERTCTELGRDPLRLSQSQAESLKRHRCSGNIRELKNVIERAVILSKSNRARLDLAMPQASGDAQVVTSGSGEQAEFVTDAQIKAREKVNMIAALRHANWRIWGTEGAAELLGLKPSTLT